MGYVKLTDETRQRIADVVGFRLTQGGVARARIRALTSSGSAASEAAVKPTRSQNRTETTFRSSSADGGGCAASGAAQKGQKGNSPGSSFPQLEQVATSRV